ncbi:MAG: hypothetical protein II453_00585 [Alphaproteobacteria bacterium]|nr:hypothetical protein [Alphaproteobacteria bacterium]MBQ3946496.1 hypothetical protein [Alphaproteobacteria bacterium]
MEKKRRKRIAKRLTQVGQEDYSWDYWDTSKDDFYPVSEAGEATRSFIQCSTKMVYETFGKASECSNNLRQHYCSDGKEKIAYGSLSEARAACTAMWDKNEDMHPYRCTYCNQYHLGHKWGEGHSIAYNFYKGGEVAGLLIDLAFHLKELFAKDKRVYTCPY